MSTSQCTTELRPIYQVLQTNYMCWQDVAIVRLKDLFDSIKQFPLSKKVDAQLRLYLNVGAFGVGCIVATPGSMVASLSTNTFTDTCPLMLSSITQSPLPGATAGIVCGLSIAKQSTTNIFGVNLAASASANALTSCRLYYPMVELKPEKAISYISENRAKKVCYTSILSNTFNNITTTTTFSALVQSGVQRIRGVLIMPFFSGSTHGTLGVGGTPITGITSFSPLISPFCCDPVQNGPISLINVNCAVGGKNVLQNALQYTYQDWLEQVSKYEKIGNSDLGLSCGLLSQYALENASRFYYIDCSRGTVADGASLRNLTVTFTNNCLQTIDCLIFTEYFDELTVNVADGRITK